ncbi:MAG: M20/M25/M40 family metallo-hydrolase [Solirubrobacteraceae bacterium]
MDDRQGPRGARERGVEAARAAVRALGADRVDADADAIMASEDFGVLAQHVPGCFVFLGNGDSAPLHSRDYEFTDDILTAGVAYYVEVVRESLPTA